MADKYHTPALKKAGVFFVFILTEHQENVCLNIKILGRNPSPYSPRSLILTARNFSGSSSSDICSGTSVEPFSCAVL